MTAVLTELIALLVAGISTLGTGIATGVNTFVDALFLTHTEGVLGLSTFGGVIGIFGGVALAVGLTTLIFHFIKSLGK